MRAGLFGRLTCAALCALAGACAAPGRAVDPADVPSLQAIFSGAELLDKRPQLLAIAADGSSVVVRWSPGIPIYAPEEGTLRVLETGGPRAGERCGIELAALLPPPPRSESQPASQPAPAELEPSAWTYDLRGGALYVARGSGLWRIDPLARTRFELLPERRTTAAESANALAGTLGALERLEWPPHDEGAADCVIFDPEAPEATRLRIYDSDDLFAVGAARLAESRALEPADLECQNLSLGPRASALQWSSDLAVAFSPVGPIVRGATPEETRPAQVWLRDEGRAVELLDYDSLEHREGERLSPDGSWVFALQRDKSRLSGPIPIPDFLSERVSVREGRRETAEDGPSAVRMYCWDTTTGQRREVALCEPFDTGWYSVVDWSPEGDELVLRWTAPDWKCQQYLLIGRAGWGELSRPRDCTGGWVGGPANQFAWDARSTPGERIWYAGVERADSASIESSADFAIPGFAGEVDRLIPLREGGLLVEAATADPGRHELHVIGPEARRILQPPGFNTDARASRDGSVTAFLHESSGATAEIWASDARGVRRLSATAPEGFARARWQLPTRRSFRSADGTNVWANVWLAGRRDAPCVVFVHGAGYLQNVTDSLTEYPLNWMFHARLARLGYAVVDVDYRGSKGYGHKFRTDVHGRLGELELSDINAVLDALAAERALDRERVALYGGSYGGFLTLMALFKEPGRWRAGAALRSVTDWRGYTPSYTQPRLGKPSTHPEAYAAASPIDHAAGLADPLFLLHGLRDDNVFAQDTLRLVERLIVLGKDFELMVYPSQGHAYDSGPHWLDQYERIESFLRRHLHDGSVEAGRRSR
ncbi:MAG: S9 family peptidase [Planctomycetes bacterium]|nr:S9 family peptidase [Planctomycetota bacterium]